MRFFIHILNSKEFSEDSRFSNEIQVLNFGGNEDLSKYLEILSVMEGYSNVKAIMIVRDAEGSFDTATSEIQSALRKHNYSVPNQAGEWKDGEPQTAFLLFPSLTQEHCNGALEDLCYSIIKENKIHEVSEEINRFLNTMRSEFGYAHNRIFKNRLHTYLSATDDYVTMKLGEAAAANAFDCSSEKLQYFRKMFMEVFE